MRSVVKVKSKTLCLSKLCLRESRHNNPFVEFLINKTALLGGPVRTSCRINLVDTFLMAGFPPFALGFIVATALYAGCLTLPDLVTAMTGTVKLRIYGTSLDVYHQVPLRAGRGHQLVDDAFYMRKDPTVFYFHGFTETPMSLSVLTVVEALLRVRPRVNVVVVDWSKIAGNQFYPIPALMTTVIGRRVGRQIDRWIKAGVMSLQGLRLVGHSLGAQCAGFTAKAIKKKRVPYLVGLDPAFPGFFFQSAVQLHISQYDADMVTIIHTDGGVYGVPYNSGWADFYANGGRRLQPGCPANTTLLSDADFCSHWRAWQIFAESLDGGNFLAVRCDSYSDFLAGRCANNFKTRLDFFPHPSRRIPKGSYYFRTASDEPLALGAQGAEPYNVNKEDESMEKSADNREKKDAPSDSVGDDSRETTLRLL